MTKRKIFASLLVVAMLISLMPVVSLAATATITGGADTFAIADADQTSQYELTPNSSGEYEVTVDASAAGDFYTILAHRMAADTDVATDEGGISGSTTGTIVFIDQDVKTKIGTGGVGTIAFKKNSAINLGDVICVRVGGSDITSLTTSTKYFTLGGIELSDRTIPAVNWNDIASSPLSFTLSTTADLAWLTAIDGLETKEATVADVGGVANGVTKLAFTTDTTAKTVSITALALETAGLLPTAEDITFKLEFPAVGDYEASVVNYTIKSPIKAAKAKFVGNTVDPVLTDGSPKTATFDMATKVPATADLFGCTVTWSVVTTATSVVTGTDADTFVYEQGASASYNATFTATITYAGLTGSLTHDYAGVIPDGDKDTLTNVLTVVTEDSVVITYDDIDDQGGYLAALTTALEGSGDIVVTIVTPDPGGGQDTTVELKASDEDFDVAIVDGEITITFKDGKKPAVGSKVTVTLPDVAGYNTPPSPPITVENPPGPAVRVEIINKANAHVAIQLVEGEGDGKTIVENTDSVTYKVTYKKGGTEKVMHYSPERKMHVMWLDSDFASLVEGEFFPVLSTDGSPAEVTYGMVQSIALEVDFEECASIADIIVGINRNPTEREKLASDVCEPFGEVDFEDPAGAADLIVSSKKLPILDVK